MRQQAKKTLVDRCLPVLAFLSAALLFVGLINLGCVLWAYHATVVLPPATLMRLATKFQFSMAPVMNAPSAADLPGVSAYVCKPPCFYWNPSVITVKGHSFLAVRESTKSHCGGANIIRTAGVLLFRPAYNSVLIGKVNSFQHGMTSVELTARVANGILKGDGPAHFGFEDPRWMVHGNEVYLLLTREMNTHPTMFIVHVREMEPAVVLDPPVQMISVHGAGMPEKNWMHIPYLEPDSDRLLFVSSLDPLEVVSADPSTGKCELVETHEKTGRQYWGSRLSGSSPFISSEGVLTAQDEEAVFIGLSHSKKMHEVYGDGLATYVTYFTRIARRRDGTWRLIVSDPFNLPLDESKKTMRINYPTTISESPDHPDAFIISIGEMDCTSHAVKVEKQGVLDVVNGLMLQRLAAL
uniref:Uncharacterized protein n=1 Tax=Chlamydomonas euryale TaxID=1486919 RepID=A0A7R9Z613_9CHLO|mmetsp:Transcript_45083/g.134574  ORF Transcript_45083/g.134574 Transcript_45083/m.134574 type:complete len:410 (+) Transcript_45083:438-1667(+)